MIELTRIPAPYLQRDVRYETAEMRKYRHAYETPDGRWRIERHYGGCGGGWTITDTTGEHVGQSWRGPTVHLKVMPTLAAAKAFVSEWAV